MRETRNGESSAWKPSAMCTVGWSAVMSVIDVCHCALRSWRSTRKLTADAGISGRPDESTTDWLSDTSASNVSQLPVGQMPNGPLAAGAAETPPEGVVDAQMTIPATANPAAAIPLTRIAHLP